MGYAPAKASVKHALFMQASIVFFNYLFTYVSLVLQRPDFEQVKSVDQATTTEKKEEKTKAKARKQDHSGHSRDGESSTSTSSSSSSSSTTISAEVPELLPGAVLHGQF
jgi:hypothetical protein